MKRMYYWELSRRELAKVMRAYSKVYAKDIKDEVLVDGTIKKGLQSRWSDWLQKYDTNNRLPKSFSWMLIADFCQLADVYDEFKKLNIQKTVKTGSGNALTTEWSELLAIFKYKDKWDSKIAQFFIDNAELLRIKTCYYCQTAYVNTYSYLEQSTMVTRRQFDVDHFLPKDECPCLALSLFNFVPSCQVCNSRIKMESIPGSGKAEYEMFAPCSKKADYESNIQIRLRPKYENGHLRGRYIHFNTISPYEKYVNFFHLKERYEFHKAEAVRLNRLKKRYPDAKIRSIAHLLHYKPSVVKEDIFHLKYMQEEGRCFEKMTRDILR